jgi:hypothetical protein
VARQRGAALLAEPGQHVKHARRKVLLADPGHHQHTERRVLGRLHDHGVAREQGRGDLQRAQHHRRVPGDDRAHDAERLAARVAQDVLAKRQGLALQLPTQPAEVAEDIGGHARLAPRLGAQRVAGLAGDGAGQGLDLRLDRLGDARQHLPPLARRHPAPGREGGLGGLHGAINVGGAGARDAGEDLAVGGVLHAQRLAALGADPLATHQHPRLARLGHHRVHRHSPH